MRDPLKDVLGLGENLIDFLKQAGQKVVQGISGGAKSVGQAIQAVQQAPQRVSQQATTNIRDFIGRASQSARLALPRIGSQVQQGVSNFMNTPIRRDSPLGKFATGLERANYFLKTAPVISDIGYKIPKQAGENTANLLISAAKQAKSGESTNIFGRKVPAAIAVPGKVTLAGLNLTPVGVLGTYASELTERGTRPIFGEKSPIPTTLGLVAGILTPGGEAQDAAKLQKLGKIAEEAKNFKTANKFIKSLQEAGRFEEVTNLLKGTTLAKSENAVQDFFKLASKGETEIQTLINKARPAVKTTTELFTQGKTPTYAKASDLIQREGGFANLKSLPAKNRYAADEFAQSLGLNAKWLYDRATKAGVDLSEELKKFDANIIGKGDEAANFATELVNRLSGVGDNLQTQINKAKGVVETAAPKVEDLLTKTPDEIANTIKQSVKPRKFLQTVKESPATGEQLAEEIAKVEPQTYVQASNKVALQQADDIIKTQGFDTAKAQVLDFQSPINDVKTALGIRLAETAEGQGRIDEAVEIVESMDKQLREAGRFIQAASLWDRLSPDAMVRAAERTAQKIGKSIDQDFKTEIIQKVLDVRKLPEAERQNAMLGVLNFIAEKLPPTPGELFDAYRYQNMLSGLKTQERNIYQNLFTTLITRPADLLGSSAVDFLKHPFNPAARDFALADVPRYYKNVFAHTGDAVAAAKEAFKMLPDSAKFEDLRGATAIQALRRSNMAKDATGKYVTVIPRFLEAQDKFFSVLIGAGEQARLMAGGVDEATALGKAKQLAEKYLLRGELGDTKDQATIVKALDSLGQFAMKGRTLPVVGKPYSWFVPFITTPINAAKAMVEHSPLGLIKNEGLKPGVITDTEALGKAAVGSVITAYGAMLAAQDRVTWDAPTDPEAKELFYASGRKPFSVKVGENWIPMWYAGAFALPLAIPAAAKYYSEESRTAPTDDGFTKLLNIAGGLSKFVVSQTPLQGVSGFFRFLDGDIDTSLSSLAGFTASQTIPLSSLVSYVNTIIDPVYRKSKGFMGAIKKAIPFGTLDQPAYTTPTGEESRRLPVNYILPYDIGREEAGYEPAFQARQTELQQNAILNNLTKAIEEGTGFDLPGGVATKGATATSGLDMSLESALKSKEALKKVDDYMDIYYKTTDPKLRSQIEQTISSQGIDFQEANYNYTAGLDTNTKVSYLENMLSGGQLDHDSLIAVLREGRKESIGDLQFASNAVLDDLYDLDYITDAERKALKKLRINREGEVIGGGGASGGTSSGKLGAGKKVDTYVKNLIEDAQNEIIKSLGNPPELSSVKSLKKQTQQQAQKGVKIPSVQADIAIKPRSVLTTSDINAIIARTGGSAAQSGVAEAQRIIASLRGGGSTGKTPTKLSSSFFRAA